MALDEADLLLTGGYEADSKKILQAMLAGDKERRTAQACAELGITDEEFAGLKRHLRHAAQEGKFLFSVQLTAQMSIDTTVTDCSTQQRYAVMCALCIGVTCILVWL